jgi:hypothetical protein
MSFISFILFNLGFSIAFTLHFLEKKNALLRIEKIAFYHDCDLPLELRRKNIFQPEMNPQLEKLYASVEDFISQNNL